MEVIVELNVHVIDICMGYQVSKCFGFKVWPSVVGVEPRGDGAISHSFHDSCGPLHWS